MQPWQIVLLIVGIILLVYTAIEVYVIWSVVGFSNKLKRRLLAVSIILNERRDLLLSEIDGFRAAGASGNQIARNGIPDRVGHGKAGQNGHDRA